MTGPVHMNQVIFQAPTVEKIQQAEHQNPDTFQRHAAAEELLKFQQRTETVQTGVKTERSKESDPEGHKRQQPPKKKMAATSSQPADEEQLVVDNENGSGRIVDVII